MKPTRLYIEPEAEAELEDAAERYESNVPGLGFDFLSEMRRRTQDVFEYPERFPPFGTIDGVHCAHAVGRFPHLVIYLLNGKTVHVLAYIRSTVSTGRPLSPKSPSMVALVGSTSAVSPATPRARASFANRPNKAVPTP